MTDSTEPQFAVYSVTYREDGAAVFRLSPSHKALLVYLAANAGETVMDWKSAEMRRTAEMEKRKETIREHMSHLIRLGLMAEIPLVASERVLLRLTDMGRNVASEYLKHVQ
jgi:hypothetical protein